MKFEPVVGWGALPDGWRYVEVAGVAVDKKDNVFCFSRGEHPVIVFDREGHFLRSWGEGHVRRAHAITIDADETVWLTDDLHHTVRKFTADGKLLLTIGNPDTPAALQGGKPFNRPDARRDLPEDGLRVHLGRLRQFAGAQVRAGRAPRDLVGRARDRSRAVQPAPQYRHRRRRAGLRRRSGEPPRADLRRRGPLPGPVEQPAPALRALRRSPQWRSRLRGRARPRSPRQHRDAEPRPPRHRVRQEGQLASAASGDRRSGRSRASSPPRTPSSPTRTATSTWARSPTRRAASTRSRRARSAPSRNSSVSTSATRRAHLRVGALGSRLNVQKVRLAGCLRRRLAAGPFSSR